MPAKSQVIKNVCTHCGKVYQVQCKSRTLRSKFCSRSCNALFTALTHPEKMLKCRKPKGIRSHYPPRLCATCHRSYTPTAFHQKWCVVCCPSKHWRRRISVYGVTKPIWDVMLSKQSGLCAICMDNPPTDVDHCHKTGKVRGLLCFKCNIQLGVVEQPKWLEKAKVYLACY